MRRIRALALATLLALAPTSTLAQTSTELAELFAEYDEAFLALNPITATFRGDHRYDDRFVDPLSDEYYDGMRDLVGRFTDRLSAFDPATLGEQDRLSYEIFALNLANLEEGFDRGFFELRNLIPVNQFFSLQLLIPILGSGSNAQPFQTVEDYESWLSRSAGFAEWVDSAIARMEEGVARGVVQPRVIMEAALSQLDLQIVDDRETSVFWQPIENLPETIPLAERNRLAIAYRSHIETLLVPAYRRLRDYIRDDYLPHTRETVGLGHLPGGEDLYAYNARTLTTTDLSPEEIHEIGRREAERMFAEMERVRDEVGFDGDMAAFFAHLRTDRRFQYESEAALLESYEALREIVDPAVDAVFDVQPEAGYVIRPVEAFRAPQMAAGQYFRPSADGSRPGIFYVNTYQLDQRPTYTREALFLHEAIPGHHFQIALQQELEDLPAFRRFGGFTGFTEGWGLYAESLGGELGLYTDPYQRFGWLFFDIWRANRLVVDTGMHALGWTREEAIEWMASNSPMTEVDVVAEIDRYIAIPGQALAYKIGQLKIRELRSRAEEALGDAFDVRAFHNVVLTAGALPLSVLERRVERWIEEASSD